MSDKILIALQFWPGDREAAMDLARLIADLEPGHSEVADFLFVARFDATNDPAVVQHVSRKFNTYAYISRRRGVGWPAGCNDLACSTLEWAHSMIKARKCPAYKAILLLESDDTPLRRDWLMILRAQWDALTKNRTVCIAGDITESPAQHCNGNCFINGNLDVLKWMRDTVARCPARAGWDFYYRDVYRQKGWGKIPGIWSEYGVPTFPEDRWSALIDRGILLHHGCKDNSLRALVRKKLL